MNFRKLYQRILMLFVEAAPPLNDPPVNERLLEALSQMSREYRFCTVWMNLSYLKSEIPIIATNDSRPERSATRRRISVIVAGRGLFQVRRA
jgi:hypothetical protein